MIMLRRSMFIVALVSFVIGVVVSWVRFNTAASGTFEQGVSSGELAREFLADLPPAPETARESDSGHWQREDLGKQAWSGYTIAVPTEEEVFFLHGRDVEVLSLNGKWKRWGNALPERVGPFSAAAWDWHKGIVVAVGENRPGFRLDVTTREWETIEALNLPSVRGTRVACDSSGIPYCIPGGRGRQFFRVEEGRREKLPRSTTVNAMGVYSAGLLRFGDSRFLAFGDHHIGCFDKDDLRWCDNRAFIVMGLRPALDRGGMVCHDPDTYDVYATLGKGSRSLGVTDVAIKRFFHLRPRLPFPLNEAGQTLYVTSAADGKRLNLFSQTERAVFSIALGDLRRVGVEDRLADNGSRWEVWNTSPGGSHGELVRERDSVCNIIFVDPFMYVQRKNLVRRFDVETLRHSENMAGYLYGRRFLEKGAGLCTDGEERLYLCNGYDINFWALELKKAAKPGFAREIDRPLEIKEMKVSSLARLPYVPAGNTVFAHYKGAVYALLDPVDRIIHRYDIDRNRWIAWDLVPNGVPYTLEQGVDLVVQGDELILLSGGWMTGYRPERGWSEPVKLCFTHSSNGGMAAVDSITQMVYVAIGGGSTDLGIISLSDGRSGRANDFFPDPVSVHGHRISVIDDNGKRFLYIYRGHDTAEFWRTRIPG